MRSGLKMKVWEAENFLNQTSDVSRSLTDPWELDPVQEYDYEGNPIPGQTHDLPFEPQILLDTIMLKGGELGILFNNVATYYKMNKVWWDKWKPTFQKWWEVEEIQYNPMWDRDGRRKYHEDIDDNGTTSQTTENQEVMDDDTSKTTHIVEVMDDDTTSSSSSTSHTATSGVDEHTVSAYNDSEYSPHEKTTSSGTEDVTTSTNTTGTDDRTTTTDIGETGTDDRTTNFNGQVDGTSTNERDVDHAYREWGQWGISTISQNMYALQYKVRRQNNPYELMSDLFIKEMTDGVWV